MRKIIQLLAVAGLLVAAPVWAQAPNSAAAPPTAVSAGAMPPQWDPRIPLPKGATLISSTVPKSGVVYSADFAVPGDYNELVKFYDTEIPKAGFTPGPKMAFAARRVYDRSFGTADILDSVLISPSPTDSSKFIVRIAYTPPSK
ncbi:MAG TPA: hypothetical protein VJX23_02790 [Candidatus Binataceae bacterium]|nr:hypothetical protein [Candidatus Binataceae bacterium]